VTVIGEIERPESFEAELEYKSFVGVLLPSDSFHGHNLDMAAFSKFHNGSLRERFVRPNALPAFTD
jgi:hypothetical protein